MPNIIVKAPVSEPTSIMNEEIPDPLLTSYFELNPNKVEKSDVSMINDIKRYLSEVSEEEIDQLQELRTIRSRLGSPQVGVTDIEHIHRYIKLREAMKEAEVKVREMEK